MKPELIIAIAALTISFLSFIGTAINSVFTAKTYAKNRTLEFLQKRDHLSQKISDLNDRNTETRLIVARYQLVVLKAGVLALEGEQAENNAALIASINKLRERVENGITLWDNHIEKLHVIYSNLTPETDASAVDELIASLQVASDDLKKTYNENESTLHVLETTNEFIKTNLVERDEKIRQINLNFERAIEKINLDLERAIEKINLDFERAIEKLK